MHVVRLETSSSEQTETLGALLGQSIEAGIVVTLSGPFGAGKTTFVQGLGRGMGIQVPIVSPSFALVNEYQPQETGGRLPFFHFDFYRLQNLSEVQELDLDDYVARRGVITIEWPEIATSILPDDHFAIEIRDRETTRQLEFTASGPISLKLLDVIGGYRPMVDGTTTQAHDL